MIEPALRKFCESRHRKLIVIAGTFIVGLVLILPLVDLLRAGRDEKASLLAELDSAQNVAAEMKEFEVRVAERLSQAKEFEARTVDDESMPALRGKLVDLAKETGCSIRRLNVGATGARVWKPGESPFAQTSDRKPTDATAPVIQLEWRPVSISLSGTGASLRSMVERVAASGMLMHTKSLEMYPSSPTRQNLTLDMELWYYTLAHKG
ncbi:MAG TPA: hypothetical protein VH107_05855 [Lacipirellulaceae bacterium]|jgi:hypothetical protein|nr:hypothetical protein [Lacipirellulaceae bacterium]